MFDGSIRSNDDDNWVPEAVTPKTRRFVRRRDGGKCCVPGCRASRYLEIHHIVPRETGGSHEAENLTLTCDAHHRAVHEGKLVIAGKAPAIEVRWLESRAQTTHVGLDPGVSGDDELTVSGDGIASKPRAERVAVEQRTLTDQPSSAGERDRARVKACTTPERVKLTSDALSVLVTDLRFPKHVARAAIDAAFEELGPTPALEQLLFIALRRSSNGTS